MFDINQRINGSWLDQDAYRHWCYESIYTTLLEHYRQQFMLNRTIRVIEFGSLQPTTPPIRIISNIAKQLGFKVEAEVGRPFPEDDLMRPLGRYQEFDVVIADQVLEHVLDPKEAVFNLDTILKPGGLMILCTPFLYPVHNCPIDVSRLTTVGMRELLHDELYNYNILECRSWGGLEVYRWWLDHLYSWVPIERAMIECPGFDQPEYDGDFAMIVWMIAWKMSKNG